MATGASEGWEVSQEDGDPGYQSAVVGPRCDDDFNRAMMAWIPKAPPETGFFGLDRDKPVMRSEYKLTRWVRARWWLARKIEWLACLVGGARWCP
jgi:hypothetical protein